MSTIPTFAEGEFRKATASDPDKECVQVARRDGWVELRDTKTTFGAPDDHRLVLTGERFDAYQHAVRIGRPTEHNLQVTRRSDGNHVFRTPESTVELVFTDGELAAFHDGIAKREFDTLAYA